MFSVSTKSQNGFWIVALEEQASGTRVEVVPGCGAILHRFEVMQHGQLVNVIDSYDSKQQFDQEMEARGFKSAKLSPFVCRLKNGQYKYGGQSYKVKKFYLGDNAIHGLIYDQPFAVVNQESDELKASVEMVYQYKGTDEGYPFAYDCNVRYELSAGNNLTIQTSIINQGKGIIPVCDGWHPYFSFGKSINDCQLEFQSKEILEFDEALIPTGKLIPYETFGSLRQIGDTFFDHCFTVNFAECQPMLVFRDPEAGLQLEIAPKGSYPYLQVYTPDHRNSIAFENLSAAPDAFNNGMGLISLAEGAATTFETTYTLRKLS